MDEWGLDVVVSGSQKAFMIPPGLSFLAFSEKALQAHQKIYYAAVLLGYQRGP
jgi:aspartate aminotransferase-like enzyme